VSLASPTVTEVREEIGSPSTADISDVTLQRLIDEETTLYGAACRAAEILARKYAFKADIAVGDYREALSQVAERWQELAADLRRKAAVYGQDPFVGGISKAKNQELLSDPDRPEPDFVRGQWDDNYT